MSDSKLPPELFDFIRRMREDKEEERLNPIVSISLDLFVSEAIEVMKLVEKMRSAETKK